MEELKKNSVSKPGKLYEGQIQEDVNVILEDPDVVMLLEELEITADEVCRDLENQKFIIPAKSDDETSYAKKYIKFEIIKILTNKYSEKVGNGTANKAQSVWTKYALEHNDNMRKGKADNIIDMIEKSSIIPSEDGKSAILLTKEQAEFLVKRLRYSSLSITDLLNEMELEDELEDELGDESANELKDQTEGKTKDESEVNPDEQSNEEIDGIQDNEEKIVEEQPKNTIESLNLRRYEVKNNDYFEMHPEHRDATFVKPLPGSDIEQFANKLLLLKKDSKNKIIGVFNGISIDVSKYNSVAEIQEIYREEMQHGNEDGEIKAKGEFLEERSYYYQFLRVAKNPGARKEIEEYNRNSNQTPSEKEISFSNVWEAKDGVDAKDFLEAVKYMDESQTIHGEKNYVRAYGMLICSSEFESADELAKKIEEIGKIQAYNNEIEEHPEKHPDAKKQEIFIHSKSFYQSKVVIDRVATNEQVKLGNENARVIKASKGTSPQIFAEASRYFGARNSNILAKGVTGEVLRPSEFANLEEMNEARRELVIESNKRQKQKIAEDKSTAKGTGSEYKSPIMFEKDLSDTQRQRWKIEHPDDYDAGLENGRRELAFINKITIQDGMKLDDIVADIEDFKARGFDVSVNLFGNTLDTRMCQDVKEIKGLVEATIYNGQSKQVKDQRTERENDVFENEAVGVDMGKINSVLATITEETLENSNNGAEMAEVAEKMREDGIELGIVKERVTEEPKLDKEDKETSDEER